MKKNMEERINRAQKELDRALALSKVYESLYRDFERNFMDCETDDEGNWKTDENGDYIMKELDSCERYDFNYNPDFFNTCKEVYKEVLDKILNMK